MKNIKTLLFFSIFIIFINACSSSEVTIDGRGHLLVEEKYEYKLKIESSNELHLNNYSWSVTPSENTSLTDNKSSNILFTAKYAGNYLLQVTFTHGNKEVTISKKITVFKKEKIFERLLPVEPEDMKNDETLIGIDSNSNGIRDDVERKILKKYNKKVQAEFMLERAKLDQMILSETITKEKARGYEKIQSRQINCSVALSDYNLTSMEDIKFLENITYNTKNRVKAYLNYNLALSGGVYGTKVSDINIGACSNAVQKLIVENHVY